MDPCCPCIPLVRSPQIFTMLPYKAVLPCGASLVTTKFPRSAKVVLVPYHYSRRSSRIEFDSSRVMIGEEKLWGRCVTCTLHPALSLSLLLQKLSHFYPLRLASNEFATKNPIQSIVSFFPSYLLLLSHELAAWPYRAGAMHITNA